MINGPIPITADGEPVIGLSPELDNFYLCCGFTSGIAASGGAGWVMANWIVDGDPGPRPVAVRRAPLRRAAFGQAVHVRARRRELRPLLPHRVAQLRSRTPAAARAAVRCTRRWRAPAPCYGNKFGWERPNWFAAPGTPPIETPSFERGPAFDAIGAEHRAVRERVALIDMTSFSKYEVRGPGALALLQKLAVNDLDRARRHDRLHAAVQRARRHRGGRDDHAARRRPLLLRHRQRARRARPLDDRAPSARGRQRRRSSSRRRRRPCSICAGRAPATCSASLTDAPLDNASFPYMSARAHRRRLCACARAARHVPGRAGLRTARAGRIRAASVRAAVGGRRAPWHRQRRLSGRSTACASRSTTSSGAPTSRSDYNPYEAGLGFCVAAGQGRRFSRAPRWRTSRRAGRSAGSHGSPRRRSWICSAARSCSRATACWAASPAAGYGYTVGRNIFCAYVAADEPVAADVQRSRSWASVTPRFATRGRCTIPTAARSLQPEAPTAARRRSCHGASSPCRIPLSRQPPSSTRSSTTRREGHGMPRAFYHDDALYAAEIRTIWHGGWLFAGFEIRDSEARRFPDAGSRRIAGAGDPRRRGQRARVPQRVPPSRHATVPQGVRARARDRVPVSQLDVFAAGRRSSHAPACTMASTSRSSVSSRCTPK